VGGGVTCLPESQRLTGGGEGVGGSCPRPQLAG
jgi:hypothetical protein